jgi:hypothetical protein
MEQDFIAQGQRLQDVRPEPLPLRRVVTRPITAILKALRINDEQYILIKAQGVRLVASFLAQCPVVEPVFPTIIILGKQTANPYDGSPFHQT